MAEVQERMNPSRPFPLIVHGLPYTTLIPKHLRESLSSSHPYILISGSLARDTSTLADLTAALHASDISIAGVRRGMTPHTLYSEVLAVASDVQQSNADSILVIGGGSLVDAAKAIVFALANGADTMDTLAELLETSNAIRTGKLKGVSQKPSVIPLMCATTTLSAGEFNPHGGATDDRTKHKQLFTDPNMEGHKIVVCDPALTLPAPMRVWLSTGLRAVDHCVESICSSAPREEGTEAALTGLRRLVPSLLRAKEDPTDEAARLEGQLGSMESMRPFVVYGVPVGASHGIGHQIGPMGVPHAGGFLNYGILV
jgi:alcohol dehydrogenase class IV